MHWNGPNIGARHGDKLTVTIAGSEQSTGEYCEATIRVRAEQGVERDDLLFDALKALHELLGTEINKRRPTVYPENK
jgi:hypothetical protein